MPEHKPPLLRFPCLYPLKVIGKNEEAYHAEVHRIAKKHIPSFHESQITLKSSGKDAYCSFTITFTAESNEQLENLYRELSAHKNTILVL